MNKDIITQVLQEILQENPNYFLPKQFHVLTWKSKRVEGALITKINGQRYLGLPRKDKIGQGYWCYKPFPPENSGASSAIQSSSLDNIAKFKERPEKTQQINHDESNSEPAVNEPSQPNS